MRKAKGLFFLLCVASTAVVTGCGANIPAIAPVPTQTFPPTATQTPIPPTATETPTPTATPIPVSVFAMPDMLVDIAFIIPVDVASGGTYEFVPYGSQYKKQARLQKILPRFGQITLTDYPAPQDALEEPAIRVFTVLGMMERYKSHVISVQNMRAGGENELAKLPTFPNLEVAALQTRLIMPISFKNGSGLRYINFEVVTEKENPIPRVSVSYIFQGITNDDNFYVSAILPIDLPPLHQKAQELFIQSMTNPTPQPLESYFPEFLVELEQAPDEQFVPSLIWLDEIIMSIEVTPK